MMTEIRSSELTANDTGKVRQIDFSKYQTAELFDSVSEILSVGSLFYFVWKWTAIATVFGILSIHLVFGWQLLGAAQWLFEVLAIGLSLLVGAALAIALAVNRSFGQVLRLFDLSIETTATVARDGRDLTAGQAKMPNPSELLGLVYTQVMLPIMEKAFFENFSWFARPLLWVYSLGLGKIVKVVTLKWNIAAIECDPESLAEANRGALAIEEVVQEIGEKQDLVQDWLHALRKTVELRGGQLRRILVWPCYGVVSAVFLVVVALLYLGFKLLK